MSRTVLAVLVTAYERSHSSSSCRSSFGLSIPRSGILRPRSPLDYLEGSPFGWRLHSSRSVACRALGMPSRDAGSDLRSQGRRTVNETIRLPTNMFPGDERNLDMVSFAPRFPSEDAASARHPLKANSVGVGGSTQVHAAGLSWEARRSLSPTRHAPGHAFRLLNRV